MKITNTFIEELRLDTFSIKDLTLLLFENESKEIVPTNLTHHKLLQEKIINNHILDIYFSSSKRLISDSEFEFIKESGYIGTKDYLQYPYSIIINGAFFDKTDFLFCLLMLEPSIKSKEYYYLNGKKITKFSDLKPYFIDYSEGFKDGFNSFEASCIKPYCLGEMEKQDIINKTFEFLAFNNSHLNSIKGFTIQERVDSLKGHIIEGFEHGQRQGHFYKAWSLVFSNSKLFDELFNDLLKKKTASSDSHSLNAQNTKNEYLLPQPIDINQNTIKKIINNFFEAMDKKGWKYAFISENDYQLFADLLTNFFEHKDYAIPIDTISMTRDCKTKVAKTLREIHKELSNGNKLSADADFFKIIRVLNHFKDENNDNNLYRILTK